MQQVTAGNSRGGLELSPAFESFDLHFEDTRFDPKTALSAYRKLTQVDKVAMLISFGGATCEVLKHAAQRDRIVHIAAGCNTAQFQDRDSYNFRLDVNEKIAAEKTAEYIKSQNISNVALLYISNSWAETIINRTKEAFTSAEIEIGAEISFPEDAAVNLKSELGRLKKKAPEMIFMISLPEIAPTVLKQINELRIASPIMSNISVENPEFISLAGSLAEGIKYLSVKPDKRSKELHAPFYSKYPEGNPFAAWGYDSLLLLAHSLKQKQPKTALQQLDDFVGAFNAYSFDTSGELHLQYEIRVIQNGNYRKMTELN